MEAGKAGCPLFSELRLGMFSQVASRLHAETNPLYQLRDSLAAQGLPIVDLVSGNVNELGIVFPQDLLANIMERASRRCAVYRPDSFGQEGARAAISAQYGERGVRIPADSLVLTPGTSMAYWYCFKLLADEGDEILCPHPSYPLFDYIAALSGARLIHYRLDETRDWAIDLEQLEANISTRTRALVLISPHNPTGHVSGEKELEALADIAARHDLALISDEVFSEFLLDGATLPRPAGRRAPLVLTLNGFSKMLALPGIKLGWMAITGDPDRVNQALRALELISDTFLPVSEIVQAAVPDILLEADDFRTSYRQEILRRWECARILLSGSRVCDYVPPGGGFYLTLRIEGINEERAAERLLQGARILAHPGFFYDLEPDHLVLSFVHQEGTLRDALPRMLDILAACAESSSG
jgi:hypothetical protein